MMNDLLTLVNQAKEERANMVLNTNHEANNPKQIFIDWAKSIQNTAYKGKERIKSKAVNREDDASDCFGEIIGQCKAIISVLENTR